MAGVRMRFFGPLSGGFMVEFPYSYPDENLTIKKAVYDF